MHRRTSSNLSADQARQYECLSIGDENSMFELLNKQLSKKTSRENVHSLPTKIHLSKEKTEIENEKIPRDNKVSSAEIKTIDLKIDEDSGTNLEIKPIKKSNTTELEAFKKKIAENKNALNEFEEIFQKKFVLPFVKKIEIKVSTFFSSFQSSLRKLQEMEKQMKKSKIETHKEIVLIDNKIKTFNEEYTVNYQKVLELKNGCSQILKDLSSEKKYAHEYFKNSAMEKENQQLQEYLAKKKINRNNKGFEMQALLEELQKQIKRWKEFKSTVYQKYEYYKGKLVECNKILQNSILITDNDLKELSGFKDTEIFQFFLNESNIGESDIFESKKEDEEGIAKPLEIRAKLTGERKKKFFESLKNNGSKVEVAELKKENERLKRKIKELKTINQANLSPIIAAVDKNDESINQAISKRIEDVREMRNQNLNFQIAKTCKEIGIDDYDEHLTDNCSNNLIFFEHLLKDFPVCARVLVLCCRIGHYSFLSNILDLASPKEFKQIENIRESNGDSLLHITVRNSNVKCTRILLQHSFNYELRNKYLKKPLSLAKTDEIKNVFKIYFSETKDLDLFYVGEWKNCVFHGTGKLYKLKKRLIGKKKKVKFYEGEFENGKMHGYGTLFRKGKIYFQGQFSDNKRIGIGRVYTSKKKFYEQNFDDSEEISFISNSPTSSIQM